MDDLIYLIVLIAWVVFAFYRKSQKKAGAEKEPQPRPEARGESFPFPTLDDILRGDEPAPAMEPVPATRKYTTDGEVPVLKETAFEMEYNRRGITSVEEMDRPFTLAEQERFVAKDNEVLPEDHLNDDRKTRIDLRQAVIYSEILNRPYV